MEEVDPLKVQNRFLREKINSLGIKIKAIAEQGRAISSDASQLFLFKGMFRELKPYFDTFNATCDKLTELSCEETSAVKFPGKTQLASLQQVERYYYEACAIYEEHMNPTPSSSTSIPAQRSNSSVLNESCTVRARLPQINLPQFNGNPLEWPLFRDTYLSLIHEENTLSNMEKFLFLVSCASGTARSLIANVSLIEANYTQAWNILMEHYNDKRKLANTYLKQILDFKPINGKSAVNSLKTLITSVIECIDSFKHLQVPNEGEFILSFLVLRCLDSVTKTSFEKKYAEVEFPSYKNLVDFIKIEWKSSDVHYQDYDHSPNIKGAQGPSTSRFSNHQRNSFFTDCNAKDKIRSNHRQGSYSKSDNVTTYCPVCKAAHSLYQCNQFLKASAENKLALLKNWTGCTNCLSSKHRTNACTSIRRCSTCNQSHHSWLHQPQDSNVRCQLVQKKDSQGVTLGSMSVEGDVLLGTALVQAKVPDGGYKNIRIVTDGGSQFSFITSKCAKKLELVIEPYKRNIVGIGEIKLPTALGKSRCTLRSLIPSFASREHSINVLVVPKISTDLPHCEVSTSIRSFYKGYALSDPEFWKPAPVELLLGGDLFFDIITGGSLILDPTIPRLLPTIFGYIVGGPLSSQPKSQESSSFFIQAQDLKDVMLKFWEMEEATPVNIISEEDAYVEDHFKRTHHRLESGRYVVSLPVKESITTLQNPQGQAFKRLMNLEAKLSKDLSLRQEYHQFMKDYLDLGHMRITTKGTSAYIIPHHAVIKNQDGNMKLRVVFDASCSGSSGSLNDHLYSGPKLQLDIRDILMNFRTHQIVFTADIVKMYRQIEVLPSDRKYQHVLWRFDPSESVEEYELCTVTQGCTSAPFNAERTIVQLVQDEGTQYPLASKALLEDIYVDDIASGANSINEVKALKSELIQILDKGCFELSKWASNSQELLKPLNDSQCQLNAVSLSSDTEAKIKLLGIQWIPNSDIFTYQITTPPWHPSKRAILSAIARIYDPLGFLSPVVFYAKTILQDMWVSQCDWDQFGPPQICHKWHKFITQLDALSDIRIPRCIVQGEASSVIIGFSDASQRGFSAVVYLLTKSNSENHVHLIKAKTKLAPIKPMTIPRLELSGALLLSRLVKSCEVLNKKIHISETRLFTDSEVVLGWLSTQPQRLNTFVAHRVVQILELTDRIQWSHVKSEDNPADCSSRGILPSELLNHSLWWAGPHWLKLPQVQWPHNRSGVVDLPEIKKTPVASLAATKSNSSDFMTWMERFSSYNKLLRSTSYMFRFIKRLKRQSTETGSISINEMREASKICIKMIQNHPNLKGSEDKHIRSLHPFTDKDNLLRVGGRLQNSVLSHDAKHPIIIPGKSHFAKILIDHYHVSYLHLGSTALQSLLQSKYWIIGARKFIRKRIFNCIKCFKINQKPRAPIMGNLPAFRIEGGQAFNHVGVDFGGPFYIRESSSRKAALGKAYLALFICMASKAVHLEVVSKCSTEAFLAAFDRFVARRGKPMRMFSDCGTNFVGAANKLKDILLWQRTSQAQEDITHHATVQEIQWSFNPPSSPHFGGIWEAGIKAAKSILNKIIGETPLTFEELTTLFCRIEGVLNSRPLTPVGMDPECIECLTPGHFLVGRPLTAVPENSLLDEKISPLKRWNMIQQRSQHFWSRWRCEYLNELQQRKKWTGNEENIKEGDLVIIKEPNSPERSWPLARVTATHPGKDGIVRVVTIKTSTGTYKRPVVKLVPLIPVNNNFMD